MEDQSAVSSLPVPLASESSSARVCQFFLRGRCNRDTCEFRHDTSKLQQQKPAAASAVTMNTPMVAVKSSAPPPSEENPSTPAAAAADASALSHTVEESIKETSTFIAATSDEQPSTPLLVRRARPLATAMKSNGGGAAVKEQKSNDPAPAATAEAQVEAQTLESPHKLNEKTLEEESVQGPVRDSVTSGDQAEAQPPMDTVSADDSSVMEVSAVSVADDETPAVTSGPENVEPVDVATAKKSEAVANLSKEWGDDEEEAVTKEAIPSEGDKVAAAPSEGDGEAATAEDSAKKAGDEETIESIENFIQDDTTVAAIEPAGKSAGKESDAVGTEKNSEDLVTAIFGDNAAAAKDTTTPVVGGKKSVYDLNPEGEDFSVTESTPFTAVQPKVEAEAVSPIKRAGLAKKDGVTKIGNNTYFYSGPKSKADQDLTEEETEEDEDDPEMPEEGEEEGAGGEAGQTEDDQTEEAEFVSVEEEGETATAPVKKRRSSQGKGYAQGRRKHNTSYVYGARSSAAKTRRCGECEGCNREDCGKCSACMDKPKFGGRGNKKQACIYRMCAWKNPSGKRIMPGTAPVAAPPIIPPTPPRQLKGAKKSEEAAAAATPKTPETKRGRKSISVISPASVPKGQKPSDTELPAFDPATFKPGYTPPVVKKGEDEYNIIVSGVKDTGLCGKYWADLDSLPPRRRRTTVEAAKAEEEAARKAAEAEKLRKRPSRKQSLKQKVELGEDKQPSEDQDEDGEEEPETEGDSSLNESKDEGSSPPASAIKRTPSTAGRKRKANDDIKSPPSKKAIIGGNGSNAKEDKSEEEQMELVKMPPKTETAGKQESLFKTPTPGATDSPAPATSSGANRSVAVAGDETQREVVVECFAPYDDHRWVNIGKERDGMAPDAVQYARALRPPYHLLSFLRIKKHSTKGMSCTDKNTMVFVVLEGEITVVLHTTQFNAKKGDSFYIPPKNYYNLINQKGREAELSLIQFQYDGPLPTVAAASQSGKPAAANLPSK